MRTLFGRHKNKAEVDYTVEVPYDTSVTARSLSGDIKVVKVRGELQLETTNGNVEAMGTPRLVRLKSFSGDVVVTDAGAADGLSASTVSGDLMIKSLKARVVDLVTVSGDLTLLSTCCERAQLRTVNGDVEFSGGLAPGGRYEFNSHSGDISLHLAGNQGFELSATTFSGEVHTGLPLTMVTRPDAEPARRRAAQPGCARDLRRWRRAAPGEDLQRRRLRRPCRGRQARPEETPVGGLRLIAVCPS